MEQMMTHMHTHEHTHLHEHSMQKSSDGEGYKLIRLLEYIYTHNISHTEELNTYVNRLQEMGNDVAAEKLKEAVRLYQEGNENIHLALHILPTV